MRKRVKWFRNHSIHDHMTTDTWVVSALKSESIQRSHICSRALSLSFSLLQACDWILFTHNHTHAYTLWIVSCQLIDLLFFWSTWNAICQMWNPRKKTKTKKKTSVYIWLRRNMLQETNRKRNQIMWMIQKSLNLLTHIQSMIKHLTIKKHALLMKNRSNCCISSLFSVVCDCKNPISSVFPQF